MSQQRSSIITANRL